jgi:hypothetical protein
MKKLLGGAAPPTDEKYNKTAVTPEKKRAAKDMHQYDDDAIT